MTEEKFAKSKRYKIAGCRMMVH